MVRDRVKHKTRLSKISNGRLKETKEVGSSTPNDVADASPVCVQSSSECRGEKLPAQAENRTVTFVPVVSSTGKVLMPTTPQRARELIRKGKAVKRFRVGIFYIKLLERSEGKTQPIAVGIDPGSKREAYTVKSEAHTYLNVLSNAIGWVKDAMEVRRNMRRTRRGRSTPYRKCRFNRTIGCIPPSTKSRWQLKLRVSNILCKLFPITSFIIEDVKAKTWKNAKKWNTNFSQLEVGKEWFYTEIKKLGELHLKSGWETKQLRDLHGLNKTKNKMKEIFSSHNVDSFVLANWLIGGHTKPDNTSMYKLDPIQFHRRQLHRLESETGGIRKRYGGTMSLGIKKGSIVTHNKYGLCYVGGNSNERLSLHSIDNGKRLCTNAKKEDIVFITHNVFKYYQIKEAVHSSNG
jgi:hypothetical protein